MELGNIYNKVEQGGILLRGGLGKGMEEGSVFYVDGFWRYTAC